MTICTHREKGKRRGEEQVVLRTYVQNTFPKRGFRNCLITGPYINCFCLLETQEIEEKSENTNEWVWVVQSKLSLADFFMIRQDCIGLTSVLLIKLTDELSSLSDCINCLLNVSNCGKENFYFIS